MGQTLLWKPVAAAGRVRPDPLARDRFGEDVVFGGRSIERDLCYESDVRSVFCGLAHYSSDRLDQISI